MPKGHTTTEVVRERACDLYRAGLSVAQVADQLGISRGAVYWAVSRKGISRSMSEGQRLRVSTRKPKRTGWERPTTKHRQLKPTVKGIAWLAGILEGEGSFANRTGRVAVNQRDPELPCRLELMFGGNIRQRKEDGIYVWHVSGSRARGIMMTVYHMMSDKRQGQIRKALGWRNRRKN
jgi:hypothetical protein